MDTPLLTVKECARFTRIGENDIRKLCWLDEIPHIRRGKRPTFVFHKPTIAEWLRQQQRMPKEVTL